MGTGGFAFPEFTLFTRQSTHSDKEASTMSLSLGARPSKNRIMDSERGARGRLACLGTLSPEAQTQAHVVSEPDPRKIGKEGLVNGAGWKCTLRNVGNFINCRTLQSL